MAPARERTVTVNEVLRLAKRVFLALGAGPGCERDPACALTWLETRGLEGLRALHADLAVLGAGGPTPVIGEVVHAGAACLQVDARGGSAAALADGIVDWQVAAAPAGTVSVRAVRSAHWFVACLAARDDVIGQGLSVRDARDEPVLEAWVDDAGCAVWLWRDVRELRGLQTSVSLGAGSPPGYCAQARRHLAPASLAARDDAALAQGVRVDDAVWAELVTLSRAALVPESEASRARGAGGGDDNA